MSQIKVSALAFVAALALTAACASAASASIRCSKLKGVAGATVTISKCTPSAGKGYKSLTGPAASLSGGTFT
jgi:hypothetical protein